MHNFHILPFSLFLFLYAIFSFAVLWCVCCFCLLSFLQFVFQDIWVGRFGLATIYILLSLYIILHCILYIIYMRFFVSFSLSLYDTNIYIAMRLLFYSKRMIEEKRPKDICLHKFLRNVRIENDNNNMHQRDSLWFCFLCRVPGLWPYPNESRCPHIIEFWARTIGRQDLLHTYTLPI